MRYAPEDVIQMWYEEIDNYDFNDQGFSHATKHFTQVAWGDSVFLGVAKMLIVMLDTSWYVGTKKQETLTDSSKTTFFLHVCD